MTDEQKAKLAQGRAEARARKQAEKESIPDLEQTEIPYGKYIIVTEPHGRVMVTKDGLHVTEYIDLDSDIALTIKQAEAYIDAAE